MTSENTNTESTIPYLYPPEYSKFLLLKQDCQKQNAEILATIENLSSLDQWNAHYETQLWRIKLEYAIAMMERYGHVNAKIKASNRPLPKLVYRLATPSDNEAVGEPPDEDRFLREAPQTVGGGPIKRSRQRRNITNKDKCTGDECIVRGPTVSVPEGWDGGGKGRFDRFDAYAVDEL
jgi:hypothetical protein